MLLVRDVFQAKYGKGGELVALLQEARQHWPAAAKYGYRIPTDASCTISAGGVGIVFSVLARACYALDELCPSMFYALNESILENSNCPKRSIEGPNGDATDSKWANRPISVLGANGYRPMPSST